MKGSEYDYLLQLWRMVAPYGHEPAEGAPIPAEVTSLDIVAHLKRQQAFSEKAFGHGPRTRGIIDHIKKELVEIKELVAQALREIG